MSGSTRILGILAIAVVPALGCGRLEVERDPDERRQPVRVEALARRTIVTSVPCAGDVVARRSIALRTRVAGRLAVFDLTPGRRVESGERVAEVRSRELDLAVEAARIQVGAMRERVAALREEAAQGLTSGFTLKEAQTALDEARNREQQALERLSQGRLTAPFDGVLAIGDSVVDGQWVDPGVTVATVLDPGELVLDARVAAADIDRVRPGLAFVDRAGAPLGVVEEVEPTLDPITRTARVRVRLGEVGRSDPAGDGTMRGAAVAKPGTFLDGRIVTGRLADVLSVPRDAVVGLAGGKQVFVVRDRVGGPRVSRERVQLGATSGDRVEILSGLEEGARVVVEGVRGLGSGTGVIVVP